MKAWVLVILLSLFLVSCGGEGGEKDLTSLGDSVEYIDPNSITDKHIEIAGQVDEIIDNNQNMSLDDFYEKIKQIDGINVVKIGDDVEVKFGELSIVYAYSFPDLYSSTKQSKKFRINKQTRSSYSTNESGNCINQAKNALFLIVESSNKFDDDFTKDIFEETGYCVDIKIDEHVTFDVLDKADQYNFVYILTHSNEKSDLAIEEIPKGSLENYIESVQMEEDKLFKGQDVICVGCFLPKWIEKKIRKGTYYKTAKPEYFKKMDFSKKNTLFFFFSCNTLKDRSSRDGHSLITKTIIDNGGYGAIGFSTYSYASWANRINKIFFSYLLADNIDVESVMENTTKDITKSKIYFADLFFDKASVDSLHLQTNKTEPLYFNKTSNNDTFNGDQGWANLTSNATVYFVDFSINSTLSKLDLDSGDINPTSTSHNQKCIKNTYIQEDKPHV